MKKMMSIALMLCMLLTVLPAPAYAAETEAGLEVVNSDVSTIIPEEGMLPESEEILDTYAELAMYPEFAVSLFAAGESRLDGMQLVVYNALRDQISAIASGESVSKLCLKWEFGSSPLSWSYSELGVDGSDNEAIVKAIRDKLSLSDIHNYLLMDMPFELYWYDKTQGMRSDFSFAKNGSKVAVIGMNFAFSVIEAYRAAGSGETVTLGVSPNQVSVDCYAVNAAKVQAAKAAVMKAMEIVEKYKELDDYSKLKAYKDEICSLTSYNREVSEISREELEYGDPWQLIHVFDNDPNTTVVCEGYSKAFQYLCDRSEFEDEDTVCYTVTGVLNGDGMPDNGINHMWNIVSLGGKNYLVDVTNSDEGTIGKDGQLFMAGTTGDVSSGYIFNVGSGTARYQYGPDQLDLLGEVLSLSSENYSAEPAHEHSFGDWVDDQNGSTHSRTCTGENCGVVESGEHSYDESNTCTVCGHVKAVEPAPEHQHQWKDAWSMDENGHWHDCSAEDCNITDNSQKAGYETHSYGDDNICDVCGYEKPAGPEPTAVPTAEPSSTPTATPTPTPTDTPAPEHQHQWSAAWNKDESYHWHDCSAEGCHITDNSQKDGYAKHDWDGGTVTKAATATETGTMTYTCKVCGYIRTETLPVLPAPEHVHKWSTVWSGTSEYHWHECETSGCDIADNSKKDSYGAHNWDAGTVTKAATTTEAGIKTYTCQTCKLTKTEQIPVLPTPAHTHSWSSKWQYNTTHHWNECTAANCPVTNNADKYGYAAHSFGAWRTVTAATATKDGSMERKCVCGYKETRTIPASGNAGAGHQHSWGSWQFTAPNYWERICGTCGSRDIRIAEVTKPQITSGANSTWRQGSSSGLSFTSSAPLSEFVSVTLNGFILPDSYYSKAEGSTIITLNKNCLDQLGTGTHTISINSAGGSAETKFAVKASAQQVSQRPSYNSSSYPWSAPKTGDSANMGLWIGMIAVSVLVIGGVAVYVIKKKKR